ncbi:hypothetical protein DFH07DRAFT_286831 [Mycena maculata]|uniref:Uncharacterized protein n=1 Tax=Mycena maculata TaxID=230809 RepID=A0AAD7HLD4_9AGAR|nr:hypothetical protein DFH07DRAFT_286831 [Mycena maculata]
MPPKRHASPSRNPKSALCASAPRARDNKEYRCTCEKRCHGDKPVSRRTFERHAPYRDTPMLPYFDAEHDTRDFDTSDSDSDSSASDSEDSESSSRSRSSRSTSHPTSSPFKKRRLQSPDPDPLDDCDLLEQENPHMVYFLLFTAPRASI